MRSLVLGLLMLFFGVLQAHAQAREYGNAPGNYTPERINSGYTLSRITLYSGAAADIASTEIRMQQSGFRELNPVLGQDRARRIGTVVGGTIAVDLLSRYLYKSGRTRSAAVLNYAVGTMHFSFAIRNSRLH